MHASTDKGREALYALSWKNSNFNQYKYHIIYEKRKNVWNGPAIVL